jgi:hypothetical protein
MKIDKRVEHNTKSVLALKDFLEEIAGAPVLFTEQTELIEALKSQGKTAMISDPDRKISGASLGTVKRIAKATFQGGFKTLDALRMNALKAIVTQISHKERSNKVTKVGLQKRVTELEQIILSKNEDMLCLTLVIEKSLSQGRNYAIRSDKPFVIDLCKKEQREIRIMLSMTKTQPVKKDLKIV